MRATDILAALFSPIPSELALPPILPDFPRPASEPPFSTWTLETPLLRLDVPSLEQWLDLNA